MPRAAQVGFGYDPVFFVPALGKTFAELSADKKIATAIAARPFVSCSNFCSLRCAIVPLPRSAAMKKPDSPRKAKTKVKTRPKKPTTAKAPARAVPREARAAKAPIPSASARSWPKLDEAYPGVTCALDTSQSRFNC